MYESFFGLQEAPFALTPNTRYFMKSDGHQQALEMLLVALANREGFIKVTGEVGTGKTLLCRLLLNALDDRFVTAYLPNPQVSAKGLHAALADELGVAVVDASDTHRLIKRLTDRLIELAGAGKSVVLVIDEAQAMPEGTIESLRLLTNLETESAKLIQVVLFGQPELDAMLSKESLRQLRQRISFHYRLPALDNDAVSHYVQHRLVQAGYNGGGLFDKAALKLITRASAGIPRLVNVLAHKSLLAAYGNGDRQIGKRHVQRAIADTESVTGKSRWFRWRGSRA